MTKLRIVLDTNVFLVSLAPQYKYHWIYQYLLAGKFELCLTTEILLEYEEVITQRYGLERVEGMLNYLLLLPNILLFTPSFRWYLIDADHDDDKFVDCYIVANADHIVGNDKHFNVLKNNDFPTFSLLKYEEFEKMYKEKLS
jgi:putative PIN family toxin of toxin-antitoxin system